MTRPLARVGRQRGPRVLVVALTAAAVVASGCVIGKRALRQPEGDAAAVMLLSCALPQPISNIARHGWFAVRGPGEDVEWRRWEVGGTSRGDPFGDAGCGGGGDVRLHEVWRGARAERAIECLAREAPPWLDELDYLAWPGPNSNTFVDVMLRRCNLHADLPSTAIGKDYRGLVGASWTSGGTGFQVETPIVGLKLGFTEGVELHLLGLSFGIDLWPPAIIVPLGPGRIGFDDR